MIEIERLRQAVKNLYPNDAWASQVDRMPDDYVISIYLGNVPEIVDLTPKEQPPAQGKLF